MHDPIEVESTFDWESFTHNFAPKELNFLLVLEADVAQRWVELVDFLVHELNLIARLVRVGGACCRYAYLIVSLLQLVLALDQLEFELFDLLQKRFSNFESFPLLGRLLCDLPRQPMQLILERQVLAGPWRLNIVKVKMRLFESRLEHFPLLQQQFDLVVLRVGGGEESARLFGDLKLRRQMSNFLFLRRQLRYQLVLLHLRCAS